MASRDESSWPSTKARLVLGALLRKGWRIKRQRGSHRLLSKPGWQDYTFAYHDRQELGRGALELLGKKTGLRPNDL
jgi:predicted RNA binding protein YcfA (HicA-like mRNA interferase family)